MVSTSRIWGVLACAALLAAPLAAAAQQGKRASVQDVSKAVRGEEEDVPRGPRGRPQPRAAEDGRAYIYFGIVHATAIRERRAARSYAVWPRITLPEDGDPAAIEAKTEHILDALVTTLTEVAQIDWPGPAKLDGEIASQLARTRVDAILGEGAIDALDFTHIEVQVF